MNPPIHTLPWASNVETPFAHLYELTTRMFRVLGKETALKLCCQHTEFCKVDSLAHQSYLVSKMSGLEMHTSYALSSVEL